MGLAANWTADAVMANLIAEFGPPSSSVHWLSGP
jgi:hypothetical protein